MFLGEIVAVIQYESRRWQSPLWWFPVSSASSFAEASTEI
jgi:hypothetical protein